MNFAFTDEQLAFKHDIACFAQTLGGDIVEGDKYGHFPAETWERCAEHGILGLFLPEPYSGTPERDLITTILAMEALGYGCADNGLTFALSAQMWAIEMPILRFGTEEQKRRYLPELAAGRLKGAHALTEPTSGSDVYNISTHAVKQDGGYRLNGQKHLITLAPIADLALVFATIDPSLGKWGITAFLIETQWEGVTRSPVRDKMGLRTVPIGELTFENVFVPEANRLGPEGAGISISNTSLEVERCFILACQVGAMERQLEQCIKTAKERRQFGQPIGKFQSVSNRIADMKLRLETTRMLLYKVAWMKQNGLPTSLEAAMLKLHLGEAFVESGLDAIRIHGGRGYISELEVERDMRDAIGGVLYAGTSDMQRNLIARALGL